MAVVTGKESAAAFSECRELLKIPMRRNEYTANRVATLDDVGAVNFMNSGSANSFTIPPDGAVPFLDDQVITVLQRGAGLTTLVAGSGVTINRLSGLSLALSGQYAMVWLLKSGENSWIAKGDLASA